MLALNREHCIAARAIDPYLITSLYLSPWQAASAYDISNVKGDGNVWDDDDA